MAHDELRMTKRGASIPSPGLSSFGNPIWIGTRGVCPSGQWGQTVNLVALRLRRFESCRPHRVESGESRAARAFAALHSLFSTLNGQRV